jgi:pimeloyl-ACP methyl ester carboxylesterase
VTDLTGATQHAEPEPQPSRCRRRGGRVAGQASVRYGWPLHVLENAGHLVVAERPEAFLEALRAALGNR